MIKYSLQIANRRLAQGALKLTCCIAGLVCLGYSFNASADTQPPTDPTKAICTSLNKDPLIKSNLGQANAAAIVIPTSKAGDYANNLSTYVKDACCAYQDAISATECQNNSITQLFYATYQAQSIKQQQLMAALQAANG